MRSIVVVGASLAGLRAAEELRHQGFDGTITMVGDEPHRPYDRPPLSKQVLAGDWQPDRTPLTTADEGGIEALDLDWRLGARAVGLDLTRRTVELAPAGAHTSSVTTQPHERMTFDGLVIATGAVPRTLPLTATGTGRFTVTGSAVTTAAGSAASADPGRAPDTGPAAGPPVGGSDIDAAGSGTPAVLQGVHTLRTLDDCLAIRAELDATPQRVVVVGAGFIGAEVAATCRSRGLEVTLVEALPVPLERAVGPEVGSLVADLHRDHGVDVRLGIGVAEFEGRPTGDGTRVEQVRLTDGSVVPADVVVVGVGVVPNTRWLDGSGLAIDNGVVCDATGLAAPGVVAAGDVARWPSRRFACLLRVEHWDNAIAMGEHAASRLLAEARGAAHAGGDAGAEAYDPVPWFWSDQYDRKLQLAGLAAGADEMALVDGSLDERRFAVIYRRGDRIGGVLAMNRPRLVVTYRALIERNGSWSEALGLAERSA